MKLFARLEPLLNAQIISIGELRKLREQDPFKWTRIRTFYGVENLEPMNAVLEVPRPFFRYESGKETGSSDSDNESLSHVLAKQIIKENRTLSMHLEDRVVHLQFLSVDHEVAWTGPSGGEYRLDLVAVVQEPEEARQNWSGALIIEILVTHQVEPSKQLDFQNANRAAVEIAIPRDIHSMESENMPQEAIDLLTRRLRGFFNCSLHVNVLHLPEIAEREKRRVERITALNNEIRHVEIARGRIESILLKHEGIVRNLETAKVAFRRELDFSYEHPAAARDQFIQYAELVGAESAEREMRDHPGSFGRMRRYRRSGWLGYLLWWTTEPSRTRASALGFYGKQFIDAKAVYENSARWTQPDGTEINGHNEIIGYCKRYVDERGSYLRDLRDELRLIDPPARRPRLRARRR